MYILYYTPTQSKMEFEESFFEDIEVKGKHVATAPQQSLYVPKVCKPEVSYIVNGNYLNKIVVP